MKKLPFLLILFCMVLSLMVSMIIGERDLMLSAILGTFFVYYSFNKVSKKKIALFGMLGILLVAGSTQVKQISSRSDSQNEKTLEESVFGGEFITSGRNFNTILDDKNNWNFQYGIGLCYDMIHAVIPSFIIDVPNSTGWYNERYNEMRDEGYGAGFSFLAEGYLQVGYFGVILWAIIISFIMRFLYYHSNKSVFGLAAYIFMISDIMYSMRGDFSYILSPLLKQVLLSYLLVKYVFKLYPITQMRKNKML